MELNLLTHCDDFVASLPVSFVYGGKAYAGLRGLSELSRKQTTDSAHKTTTEVALKLDDNVTITVVYAVYKNYDAAEWTLWFENTGSSDSDVIEKLYALDAAVCGHKPHIKGIHGDGGVGEGPYSPYSIDLTVNPNTYFWPITGRGTYQQFPYFNLQYGDNGTFIAIGWSATWFASFDLVSQSEEAALGSDNAMSRVHCTAGQRFLQTIIKPNEKIRTPLVAVLNYSTLDDYDATNLWRHWFLDCNIRRIKGELFEPNVSGGTSWIYDEMRLATEENQMQAMDAYIDHNIPITYWWMDAGWYYRTGTETISTWLHTGTWMVDTERFPTSFKDLSEHGKERGVRTLLWFEPEVVRLDWNDADKEHGVPKEYMLHPVIADIGNPDFRQFMFDRTCSILDKGGISLYRQDYGVNPNEVFRIVDSPNRVGFRENTYVQGYYAYWDMLIERYPDMMIDSCAAGGGRNDIESMRRSVPLHKTDHNYSNQTDKQAMHMGLFGWLPYFGSCVIGPDRAGIMDEYDIYSSFCSWLALGYDVRSEDLNWKAGEKCIKEWQKVSDLFMADYYPLLSWSNKDYEWRAWQFFDTDTQRGMIQTFRPENCIADFNNGAVQSPDRRILHLHALNDEHTYRIAELNGDDEHIVCTATGKELKEQGFIATLPEPRSSKVYLII